MQLCGIYKITNKINNKSYIGKSIHILQRWKEHLLNHDDEFHQELQTYITNFNFEILELCDECKLNEREIYWIKIYNSYYNGYNLTKGGNDFPSNIEKVKRPVKQYDLQGNYIQTFSSIKEAQNIFQNYHIGDCCRGQRKTAAGYQWVFSEPKENENVISYNIQSHGPQQVIQYDLQGKQIQIFESINKAAEKLNIHPSIILKVCQHKGITAGGYRWTYANDTLSEIKENTQGMKKKVLQLSKETEEIIQEFDSISEAAKSLGGKSVGSISDVCKGKRKTAYGFKWKFLI